MQSGRRGGGKQGQAQEGTHTQVIGNMHTVADFKDLVASYTTYLIALNTFNLHLSFHLLYVTSVNSAFRIEQALTLVEGQMERHSNRKQSFAFISHLHFVFVGCYAASLQCYLSAFYQ